MFLVSPIRAASFALATMCTSAAAQEAPTPSLSIELNALTPLDRGCALSFLALNGRSADVSRAVFEAVLFDRAGRVDRLMLFDFAALPAGRPRVRQFVVPDLGCATLGRILFNGASSCEGTGLAPDACTKGLDLTTRTDVEVIG
ncbi:hypothetical protein [Aquicoccus sp. SU-CL01552]|uniref:hypothetical protein n=1 Tax=Aquicoccus sp. SU-CL01552 TaxID=3127656 RepID=UPI0031042071